MIVAVYGMFGYMFEMTVYWDLIVYPLITYVNNIIL